MVGEMHLHIFAFLGSTKHEPGVIVYFCNPGIWRLRQEKSELEATLGTYWVLGQPWVHRIPLSENQKSTYK